MGVRWFLLAVGVVAGLVCCGYAAADTLRLVDGTVYQGKYISEDAATDRVAFKVDGDARMRWFDKAQVRDIIRDEPPPKPTDRQPPTQPSGTLPQSRPGTGPQGAEPPPGKTPDPGKEAQKVWQDLKGELKKDVRIESRTDRIIAGVSVLVGLFICFWGYHVYERAIVLLGFVFGAYLAGGLAYALGGGTIGAILFGLIGGALGAGMVVFLHALAIFGLGAMICGPLAAAALTVAGVKLAPLDSLMVVLIVGVVGGFLALRYQGWLILLGSAFGGAMVVVLMVSLITGVLGQAVRAADAADPNGGSGLVGVGLLAAWILLGSGGVIVQYRRAVRIARARAAAQGREDIEFIIIRRRRPQ